MSLTQELVERLERENDELRRQLAVLADEVDQLEKERDALEWERIARLKAAIARASRQP